MSLTGGGNMFGGGGSSSGGRTLQNNKSGGNGAAGLAVNIGSKIINGQDPTGGFQNTFDLYKAFNAPTMEGFQNQKNYIDFQLGASGAGYNNAIAGLQGQYNAQQGQNQLAIQSIGVDQNAIPRQKDYYDQLFGVDREKYANNMGYQGQLKGFSTRDYASVVDQLANQANQINYTADKNIRQVGSEATSMGSFTSQGTKQGVADVNADRGFGLEANKQQGIQAKTGYERDQAGITNTMNNLTSDLKAAGLTHDEQIARLSDRQAQLGIQAQQLGLKGEELSSALSAGLGKLGIDQALNVGQLMDAMNSVKTQERQLAMDIIRKALGM